MTHRPFIDSDLAVIAIALGSEAVVILFTFLVIPWVI